MRELALYTLLLAMFTAYALALSEANTEAAAQVPSSLLSPVHALDP